jgi:hypothetical protein
MTKPKKYKVSQREREIQRKKEKERNKKRKSKKKLPIKVPQERNFFVDQPAAAVDVAVAEGEGIVFPELDCLLFISNDELLQAGIRGSPPYMYPEELRTIHTRGEYRSYDYLSDFGMRALVSSYCTILYPNNIDGVYQRVRMIPELQTLCAFFQRFKIIVERCNELQRIIYSNGHIVRTPTPPDSNIITRHPELTRLVPEEERNFNIKMGIINQCIDRVQCMIFTIVRHGGLPVGFIMDPRIEHYARELPLWTHGELGAIYERERYREEAVIVGKSMFGYPLYDSRITYPTSIIPQALLLSTIDELARNFS